MPLNFLGAQTAATGSTTAVTAYNPTTFTASGTAPANAVLAVLVAGTVQGTTTANGSGVWSFSLPTPAAGTRAISVQVISSSAAFSASVTAPSRFTVGLNITGLVGGGASPGTLGTEYITLPSADFSYMAARGIKLVRLPFKHERLQPTLGAAFNAAYLAAIKADIDAAYAVGIMTVPSMHNYCRYSDKASDVYSSTSYVLGASDGKYTTANLVDFWQRFDAVFKGYPGVAGYGLMNEPHDMPNNNDLTIWPPAASAIVAAIRQTNMTIPIWICGNNYATAQNWIASNPNFPLKDGNGALLPNLIYEAHNYSDPGGGGQGTNFLWSVCSTNATDPTTVDTLVNRFTPFFNWGVANGATLAVGETNIGIDDQRWFTCLDRLMVLARSKDIPVLLWLWGPDFTNYDYDLSKGAYGKRQAQQWPVFAKYLGVEVSGGAYLDGPPSMLPGQTVTLSLDIRKIVKKPANFTFSDGGAGGTFTPANLAAPAGFGYTGSVTYTNPSVSTPTITVSNDAGETNPAALVLPVTNSPSPATFDIKSGWSSNFYGFLQPITFYNGLDGTNAYVARLIDNGSTQEHAAYRSLGTVNAGSSTAEAEIILAISLQTDSSPITQGRITVFGGTDINNIVNAFAVDYDVTAKTVTPVANLGSGVYVSSLIYSTINSYLYVRLRGQLPDAVWSAKISTRKSGTLVYQGTGQSIYVGGLQLRGPLPVTSGGASGTPASAFVPPPAWVPAGFGLSFDFIGLQKYDPSLAIPVVTFTSAAAMATDLANYLTQGSGSLTIDSGGLVKTAGVMLTVNTNGQLYAALNATVGTALIDLINFDTAYNNRIVGPSGPATRAPGPPVQLGLLTAGGDFSGVTRASGSGAATVKQRIAWAWGADVTAFNRQSISVNASAVALEPRPKYPALYLGSDVSSGGDIASNNATPRYRGLYFLVGTRIPDGSLASYATPA